MRRYVFAVLLVFSFSVFLAAAQQGTDASSAQQEQAKKDAEKDKKDKEKKDKKKKKAKPEDVYDSAVFSQAVANNVLNDLRDGLEGHSQRLLLSAFDQDKMDGYLTFEDQIEAMMQRYDSFRVHFRISQSTIEGPKGVVLVDIDLEEMPRAGGNPIRRNGQVKFEMERGRKGWKIVDFTPRGFFS
jgi:ABC-type transporter MlaC component